MRTYLRHIIHAHKINGPILMYVNNGHFSHVAKFSGKLPPVDSQKKLTKIARL